MAKKRSNKQHLEYIFVPSGDQTLASGNINTSGNAMNIANGRLGLMVATNDSMIAGVDQGDFVTAGNAASIDALRLVMGNAYSSDTTKVRGWDIRKPYQKGPIMRQGMVRTMSARLCKVPTYSATIFNSFNSSTPMDESLYRMYIESRSVRKDRDYGRALDSHPVVYTTPDYTALGTTDPLDHLLQNMLHRVNLASKGINTSPSYISKGNKNFIGFGINLSGGSGQALGTITCGTSITVMTTVVNGTTTNSTFVADEAFVQTVADWIANSSLTTASTIETININTAGAAANVDTMVIMGLDHDVAEGYDDIYSIKTRVDVEIGEAFSFEPLYTKVVASHAFDGYGSGRQWRIRYDERAHGLDYNMQLRGDSDTFIKIDDNIDETANYHAFIIDIYDSSDSMTQQNQAQKRVIILMTCTVTCNTAGAATPIAVANDQPATVTSLNSIFGAWLDSATDDGANPNINAGSDEIAAGVTGPTTLFV